MDTTWGDGARTTDNPYVIEELFTYAYLLISDEDISSTHKARSEFNPSATTEFDVFAATESGLRLKLASVMALKPYDLLSGGIRNVYWFRRM